MTSNRSDEEEQMRQAVFAWGRVRWPRARIMEELDVGGCRIDVAFVGPDHIAGVEIKSSRDTLNRLSRQLRDYLDELPEVWIAYHPRWDKHLRHNPATDVRSAVRRGWKVGLMTIESGVLSEEFSLGWHNGRNDTTTYSASIDYTLTGPALHLLHKTELLLAAWEHNVRVKSRDTVRDLIDKLARGLTGDQIIAAVCRQLRARPRAWRGDDPVPLSLSVAA
jgi:hypothetical protein